MAVHTIAQRSIELIFYLCPRLFKPVLWQRVEQSWELWTRPLVHAFMLCNRRAPMLNITSLAAVAGLLLSLIFCCKFLLKSFILSIL